MDMASLLAAQQLLTSANSGLTAAQQQQLLAQRCQCAAGRLSGGDGLAWRRGRAAVPAHPHHPPDDRRPHRGLLPPREKVDGARVGALDVGLG